METIGKISIRGAINAMKVGDRPLILERDLYKPSSVRSVAASIKADTRKTFSVTIDEDFIIVTRNS